MRGGATSGDRLPTEEREELEKNIREQEKLMNGYQKVCLALTHIATHTCTKLTPH